MTCSVFKTVTSWITLRMRMLLNLFSSTNKKWSCPFEFIVLWLFSHVNSLQCLMIFCIYRPMAQGWALVGKESAWNTADTGDWIPGWASSLEEEMATHSRILAWEIPWTEQPGSLDRATFQRVAKSHMRRNPAHSRAQMKTNIQSHVASTRTRTVKCTSPISLG